jgi:hypothetical protein
MEVVPPPIISLLQQVLIKPTMKKSLVACCDCLFGIFAATLHIKKPTFNICSFGMPHAVVSGDPFNRKSNIKLDHRIIGVEDLNQFRSTLLFQNHVAVHM